MCMRARQKHRQEQHSATEYTQLYSDINQFCPRDGLQPNATKISEVCKKINRYCQLTIWAEKKQDELFDFFCEEKGLDMLYNLFSRSQNKDIMICIIQSLSMMLVSFSHISSIHYFLSSPAMMNILQVRFPSLDLEVAEYYINLLKSVSNKLDKDTVHIFYNEKIPTFPLLWQTIRFFNHPESLVRNTSRNIILSICRIKQEMVQNYISTFPFVIYYSHLASSLRNNWSATKNLLSKSKLSHDQRIDQLRPLVEEQEDLLLYFEEFSELCNQQSRRNLVGCLINQCIIPLTRDIQHPKLKHKPKLTLFILSVALSSFNKIPEALDIIVIILFGKYIPRYLSIYMLSVQNQQPLISYHKKWQFGHFWDKHYDILTRNCRKHFKNDLLGRPRSMSDNEGQSITKKLSNSEVIDPKTLSSNVLFGNEQLATELEKQIARIEQMFPVRIAHKQHSKNHPHSSKSRQDIFQLLEGIHKDLQQNSFINLDEMDDNKNVGVIMNYLNSEQQSTVVMCIQMLTQLLKCTTISKENLKFSGLFFSDNIFHNQNLRKIVRQLLEMFRTRSGCFTVHTYVAANDLIKIIVKENQFGLFDDYTINILMETIRIVADRLAAYASNFKDHTALLRAYSQAQDSLKTVLNKQDRLLRSLISSEQQHGVIELQSQIERDFAMYLLLAELKATYVAGSCTIATLTSKRSFDVSASSIIGKEIEFPQSHVTPGVFKEDNSNLTFKCFILTNKVGFMLSEKTSSNRGRVVINCNFNSLTCQLRQQEPKRLYYTYEEKGRITRSFHVHFDNNKIACKVKKDFDTYKHEQSKEMVANLMKGLNRCTEPTDKLISKKSKTSIILQSEQLTTAKTTQREQIQQSLSLNQNLMDMF